MGVEVGVCEEAREGTWAREAAPPDGGPGAAELPAALILRELKDISAAQSRMESMLARLQPSRACEERRQGFQQSLDALPEAPDQPEPRKQVGASDQSSPTAGWCVTAEAVQADPPRFKGSVAVSMQSSRSTSRGVCASSSRADGREFNKHNFIAATLPPSWPSVLASRCVYRDSGKQSVVPLIMDIVHSSVQPTDPRKASVEERLRDGHQSSRSAGGRLIIAPGSHRHMVFSFVSFVMLLFDFTVIPVTLAWDLTMDGFIYVASWFSVIFWATDIIANFMTAFYRRGELEFRPAAIAMRYIRRWFLFDLLALCGDGASIILQATLGDVGSASTLRSMRLVKVARLLRIIAVLRMVRFTNIIREYAEKQCSSYYRLGVKTASLLFGILLLTHTMCCAWFALGVLGPADTGTRWTDMFSLQESGGLGQIYTYQYLTSFRWAAGHMTLGGSQVESSNSSERLFEISCMLAGLFLNCMLVSSLSATLVDFQMAHKDHNHQMESLRRYLKEHCISTTTRMLVRDQVLERLKEEKRNTESGEAVALKLLSNQLFSQVRFEAFWPTVSSHPILKIWSHMHLPTMHKLCVEVLEFLTLAGGDDLFAPGNRADEAFRIESGQLEYTEFPDSSPVMVKTSTMVGEGTWMCEAALWSDWIHVGAAVAVKRSGLVVIKAEGMMRVCREHLGIETVVTSYGETFHRRIAFATPPQLAWPSDLEVPRTSFVEIVIGMRHEAQVAIGLHVLRRARQTMGFGAWAAKALGSSVPWDLHELEEDVVAGKSIMVQGSSEELERIVVVTCARIENQRGEILVQIAKQDTSGLVHAVFQLPGQQLEDELTDAEKLEAVLEARLPLLAGRVELRGSDREVTKERSLRLAMMSIYVRTITSAVLQGEWGLRPMRRLPEMSKKRRVSKVDSLVTSGIRSGSAQLILEGLLDRDIYKVLELDGRCGIYCWLSEETYSYLTASEAGASLAREWVDAQLREVLEVHRKHSHRGLTIGSNTPARLSNSLPLDYETPSRAGRISAVGTSFMLRPSSDPHHHLPSDGCLSSSLPLFGSGPTGSGSLSAGGTDFTKPPCCTDSSGLSTGGPDLMKRPCEELVAIQRVSLRV